MGDVYFVEERSGVIGLGPLTNSPDLYYRERKTNWGSIQTWIHLIICILAIPLIIWNLSLLLDTITTYTQVVIVNPQTSDAPLYTTPNFIGYLILFSAILMNLIGGMFALVTEAACFSNKLAKFLFVIVYISVVVSIFSLVMSHNLLGPLGFLLWLIFAILWGFGFWRFSIISAIYLNEEGPTWFKPLLYFCLAAIPLLTTSSQCRDTRNIVGCIPNEWLGNRWMYNDFYSFTLMIIIAIFASIPFLLGIPHQEV